MPNTPTDRLHALDAVRAFALLLGIFYHATISFFPGWMPWPIMDTQRSVGLAGAGYVSHIFRMSTFFFLAGFFGHMMHQRIGTTAFIKGRLKRIGIPFLVGWPIIFGAFIAVVIWAVYVQNGGSFPENPPPQPPLTWKTFPMTHLWFLYVLAIFYVVMLGFRALIGLIDRKQRLAGVIDKATVGLFSTPFLAVVLALPITIALILHDPWYAWWGIPTPDYGFLPNTPALIGYGTAFVFGWALHRQPKLIHRFEKPWPLYFIAAIGFTAICISMIGISSLFETLPMGWKKAGYAASYGLAIWCWTFAFIGAALRFLSGYSPVRRYLADSSYWLYLIHLPIIMAAQVFVSQLDMSPYVKYTLIMGVSLPVMLLSYHLLVRYSFIGAVLNGKRKPKRSKT
ncbi:MAG: hypothetical protein COA69_06240 [Robiginitomaculum sp.]|nr:MAG: hypothetical protein COA69_06240 [Robiginitomaculum sp.]